MVLLALLPLANAALIQGVVYDIVLEPTDALVSINTQPRQTMVARNGSYYFTVPKGNYVLEAEFGDDWVSQNVSIVSEGTFNIDLVLFPELGFDEVLLEEVNEPEVAEINWLQKGIAGLVLIVLGVVVYFAVVFIRKRKSSVLDEDLIKVLEFLKENDGRVTQKELREQFPVSEAKVSLMISDLESKGLVRKIKKGRGNIIVLSRK